MGKEQFFRGGMRDQEYGEDGYPKVKEKKQDEEHLKPKTTSKKEEKEHSKVIGEGLLTRIGVNILVKMAEKKSKERLGIENMRDLEEKNPPLAIIIEKVASHFEMPKALLCAVFYHESKFVHKAVGDISLKGASVGIGQFRPRTWNDVNTRSVKEFKEYRNVLNSVYPGIKFGRGENLFADIVATAALIKYFGSDKMDFNRLSEDDIVYLRARYTGDSKPNTQKRAYKEGKMSKVRSKYHRFLETYRRFSGG